MNTFTSRTTKATVTLTISKTIDVDTSPMDEMSDFYGLTPIDRAVDPLEGALRTDGWEVADRTYQLEDDRPIDDQGS